MKREACCQIYTPFRRRPAGTRLVIQQRVSTTRRLGERPLVTEHVAVHAYQARLDTCGHFQPHTQVWHPLGCTDHWRRITISREAHQGSKLPIHGLHAVPPPPWHRHCITEILTPPDFMQAFPGHLKLYLETFRIHGKPDL